ncbi:hypothetical protein PC111_g16174 [Phytophthora cactorum]|uniref:Reverse transcriptase RNase H-like domain-containing protein n=1 Tax=Phytophthora cactorum TaxID=29920 RepID=A0A8T1D565_9STRA|nr:hypothetical protein PC111_g16174 [Phytophthora cactorum]KAG2934869.1 hypothetical protein PC117_g12546 [Phytophthora cactorum]
MDPLQELANSPDAEMFSTGEPDESSLVPVLERRSFVDDIFFGGETFDSCLATLDRLLARFEECRISVSFTKSLFIKSNVDFLSHEVSRVGVRADPKTMQTIAALPFPTSKKGMQSFLGALNYYGRFIQDFAVYGAALATLLQEHESTLHPVLFRGRVLKDAEMDYHPAEKEVLSLLMMLKAWVTTLAGKRIKVYTRISTLEWLTKSKPLFGRAVQFAVMPSPWHLVIEKVPERTSSLLNFYSRR